MVLFGVERDENIILVCLAGRREREREQHREREMGLE